MKIEAGKYYRNRLGEKVGPMKWQGVFPEWPWTAPGTIVTYGESGNQYNKNSKLNEDLIEEWVDDDEPSNVYRFLEDVQGVAEKHGITLQVLISEGEVDIHAKPR